MDFCITGLDPSPFRPFFAIRDGELPAMLARAYTADDPLGYPCRVGLDHARLGERVILLHYTHQPADTPYRASGPIFVREGAEAPAVFRNEVPRYLASRPLSLRAFDRAGMLVEAGLAEGKEIAQLVRRLRGTDGVSYLHAHFAPRGCFAARIEPV